MKKATFDPAQNLDLYFRKARNGSKEFRFFDADGDPHVLADDFELICDFEAELTKLDNVLTFAVTEEGTENVKPSYFWEIVNTTTGRTWLCGTAFFTDTLSAEVTDTNDITIILEGEAVEVTISESGGSGVEHFQGGFDASVNIFPGDVDTLAGDFWRFTVGGTLDGEVWPAKTIAIALIDNPGQDPANWRLI